jgi:hypothetical protein
MEPTTDPKSIMLQDGTELIPLEKAEKYKLELELSEVLKKYNATYLPVIKKDTSITHETIKATLFLLKIKDKEIKSPYIENGESNTTKETPEVN